MTKKITRKPRQRLKKLAAAELVEQRLALVRRRLRDAQISLATAPKRYLDACMACGESLGDANRYRKGRPKRYCSDTCRQWAYRVREAAKKRDRERSS